MDSHLDDDRNSSRITEIHESRRGGSHHERKTSNKRTFSKAEVSRGVHCKGKNPEAKRAITRRKDNTSKQGRRRHDDDGVRESMNQPIAGEVVRKLEGNGSETIRIGNN